MHACISRPFRNEGLPRLRTSRDLQNAAASARSQVKGRRVRAARRPRVLRLTARAAGLRLGADLGRAGPGCELAQSRALKSVSAGSCARAKEVRSLVRTLKTASLSALMVATTQGPCGHEGTRAYHLLWSLFSDHVATSYFFWSPLGGQRASTLTCPCRCSGQTNGDRPCAVHVGLASQKPLDAPSLGGSRASAALAS